MSVYKYTFRFNASHSMSSDTSNAHTHSFVVSIHMNYEEHISYNVIEKNIKIYLERYKGKCLNDLLVELPTIENIAMHLFEDLGYIIGANNLISLELSDSPVQLFKVTRKDA